MDMTLTDTEQDEVNVGVRMGRDVKAALDQLAKRKRTSIAAMVRILIIEEAQRTGIDSTLAQP